MNKPDLVIFFDGQCPLCCNEMRALKTADHQARILLVDVHDTDTMSCYPSIDKQRALSILHGIDQQGQLLYGLDVTVLAWRLVNRHRWLFITRMPILKGISDRMYLLFANTECASRAGLAKPNAKRGFVKRNRFGDFTS